MPRLSPLPAGAAAAVIALLDAQRLMSLAVNRPDGWPQVTTVGYVNERLDLYFLVGRQSQKHANIVRDPRVSIAVRGESDQGDAVGVSLAGKAVEILDPVRVEDLNRMVFTRYPGVSLYAPAGNSVALYHVAPHILSPVTISGGRSRAETYELREVEPTHEFTLPGPVSHLLQTDTGAAAGLRHPPGLGSGHDSKRFAACPPRAGPPAWPPQRRRAGRSPAGAGMTG